MKAVKQALFFLLVASMFFSFKNIQAATVKDSVLVYATVYHGDTIPMGYLKQATIWCPYKFKSDKERRTYLTLKQDVLTVYPYAIAASKILVDLNQQLAATHSARERRRFIRSQEKLLDEQFKKKLVGMTTRQGRLLMLLIDRQTGNSCYELVKEFKGGFKAWVSNSMMSIYDDDLNMKRHYYVGETPLLDRVLFEIETEQLKVTALH